MLLVLLIILHPFTLTAMNHFCINESSELIQIGSAQSLNDTIQHRGLVKPNDLVRTAVFKNFAQAFGNQLVERDTLVCSINDFFSTAHTQLDLKQVKLPPDWAKKHTITIEPTLQAALLDILLQQTRDNGGEHTEDEAKMLKKYL